MTITVRRAAAADAALLSALNADVQALHAAAMPHLFKPPEPDTFAPVAAAELLARPAARIFIAEADGAPAGYAYAEIARQTETPYHRARAVVHLHHITVRPDFRRRGVGDALMATIKSVAESEGASQTLLDVWTFNTSARAFFARHGFSPYVERMWTAPPANIDVKP